MCAGFRPASMLKDSARPALARASTNLLWLGCERLVQIAVTLVISGLLARYFGSTVFGKWQYANTLLLTLTPLTWICGAEILVPTIMQRPATQLNAVLGSAFALRVYVAAVALALIWLALAAGTFDPLVGLMLAGLAPTLLIKEPFVGVVSAWLQSITYSKPQLLASIATAIAKAVLVGLFVHASIGPARFGWLWTLEAAVLAAVLIGYYQRRHGGTLGWRIERSLVRHFATTGAVFWLGLVCMYGFLKLDRLMLERYLPFAELGRYAAAQQLNENWITLALLLAQTLAPAFVYQVQNRAQLRRNMGRMLLLTTVLMATGALMLNALADPLIRWVFGPGFEAAAAIFGWAVWLSVLAGAEAISNLVVLKYQAKFVLLAKWALALATAWLVNGLAIPLLGPYGALLGLAAGYLVALTINLLYLYFKLRPA